MKEKEHNSLIEKTIKAYMKHFDLYLKNGFKHFVLGSLFVFPFFSVFSYPCMSFSLNLKNFILTPITGFKL